MGSVVMRSDAKCPLVGLFGNHSQFDPCLTVSESRYTYAAPISGEALSSAMSALYSAQLEADFNDMIVELLLFGLVFPIGRGKLIYAEWIPLSRHWDRVFIWKPAWPSSPSPWGELPMSLATPSAGLSQSTKHVGRLCERTKGESVQLSHGLAHDRRGHRPWIDIPFIHSDLTKQGNIFKHHHPNLSYPAGNDPPRSNKR